MVQQMQSKLLIISMGIAEVALTVRLVTLLKPSPAPHTHATKTVILVDPQLKDQFSMTIAPPFGFRTGFLPLGSAAKKPAQIFTNGLTYKGRPFDPHLNLLPADLSTNPKYRRVYIKYWGGSEFERPSISIRRLPPERAKYLMQSVEQGSTPYWTHYEIWFRHGAIFWARNKHWRLSAAFGGDRFDEPLTKGKVRALLLSIRPTVQDQAVIDKEFADADKAIGK